MTTSPIIALTMGDPAGIGPEIALKALSGGKLPRDVRVVVVGDRAVMDAAVEMVRPVASVLPVTTVSSLDDIDNRHVNVMDLRRITPADFTVGQVSARCGDAAYRYILKGIALAKEGGVGAVVTNPINKEALRAAGIDFPGHTEIFAHETGATDFTMMFMLDKVSVVHVTTHCSLRRALDLVTADRVIANIRLLRRALLDLGIAAPRIAVGGLNPHAGEHGLFGDEEIAHIAPAIDRAKSEGIDAAGPFPPDTVFMRAFRGEFDGVVAMLHDHGFVALKSRDFEHGVNITLGLPIVRTSVGHGTAFDIAGKGIAGEASLVAAIGAAAALCGARAKETGDSRQETGGRKAEGSIVLTTKTPRPSF